MIIFIVFLVTTMSAWLEPHPGDDLRKALENPMADISALPLSFEAHENTPPYNRTQSILNLRTHLPTHIESWTLVNRLNIPLEEQPELDRNASVAGLGDISYRGLFSPKPEKFIWGIGPYISAPSGTSSLLTSGKWAAGLSAGFLIQPLDLSVGAVFTQIASFAGDSSKPKINRLEIEPVLVYRFAEKTSLQFLDTIIADWEMAKDDRWNVPVGVQINQLIDKRGVGPVNVSFGAFGNVVRPSGVSDWYWKLQLNFVLSDNNRLFNKLKNN